MLTIDVEEWFHILDAEEAPKPAAWDNLESRLERTMGRLLGLLDQYRVKATFFWLGWAAETYPDVVERCHGAGHEIASHGYNHLLAYQVGPARYRDDIRRAKHLLEDLTGSEVAGFRAPGFGITEKAHWAFEVIRETGYTYDSSIFPASRGHGGIAGAELRPHRIKTETGELIEVPISVVETFSRRFCLFGGGYLRMTPLWLIRRGIEHLRRMQRPLIIYIHPREIDPDQPRLPLPLKRRFKSYVNLKSTLPKLEWLCSTLSLTTMRELAEAVPTRAHGQDCP